MPIRIPHHLTDRLSFLSTLFPCRFSQQNPGMPFALRGAAWSIGKICGINSSRRESEKLSCQYPSCPVRFNNPYFMTRKLLPTALFKCSLVLCLFFAQVQVCGQDVKLTFDKSIIESAILVNLNSIKVGNGSSGNSSANRRLSSQYSPIDANSSNLIQNEILSSVGPTAVSPTFVGSLTSILDTMAPGTLADGLDHTLDYLAANKISFGLNDDSLFKAIKSA